MYSVCMCVCMYVYVHTHVHEYAHWDIYLKLTNTQKYLNFKSQQPKSRIKCTLYTLARKIYTIVINKNLRQINQEELHVILHLRGYPLVYVST